MARFTAAAATCGPSSCAVWICQPARCVGRNGYKPAAQLLAAEGRILLWDEQGDLRFIQMTPDGYHALGEITGLLTYKSWAAPALAGGRLYLRDEHDVLCLELRD